MHDTRQKMGTQTDQQVGVMKETLDRQKNDFWRDLPVSIGKRTDRLRRLEDLLTQNVDSLCQAMSDDFGWRSRHASQLTDIVYTLRATRHAKKNLRNWMRSDRRSIEPLLWLLGGRASVHYQPKGVVGVISPWNFPVYLALTPIAGALAAGNRVMLKPSELTPRCSELMAELVSQYFDIEEIAVITGGIETGRTFSELPFDHLLFTGGGKVGRHIMRAAAENLVPVTLELGGKSPVIVSRSADIQQAAERIVLGKLLNAGQICLAPDYVLVEQSVEEQLCDAMLQHASRLYPSFHDNPDYTAIINDAHHERLISYIDDAHQRGATVRQATDDPLRDGDGQIPAERRLPFTLIQDIAPDAAVMTNEIFGPLLPVIPWQKSDDAIRFIKERDRPLGLYYFGTNQEEQDLLLDKTIAGGVTINDVIYHVMQEELPLGGSGESGIGRYHGHEGFLEFSHARSVYQQPKIDIAKLLGAKPPYGKKLERYIERELRKR